MGVGVWGLGDEDAEETLQAAQGWRRRLALESRAAWLAARSGGCRSRGLDSAALLAQRLAPQSPPVHPPPHPCSLLAAVIGMADTVNASGTYTLEVPTPRTRSTATVRQASHPMLLLVAPPKACPTPVSAHSTAPLCCMQLATECPPLLQQAALPWAPL